MNKIINKKAYYEYEVLKDFIAGIQLVGSEVKSLRNNNANIGDSFCYVWNNEIFIKNMFISTHKESSYTNHEERRDRKKQIRKSEIRDIIKLTKEKGITTIPLELFTVRGRFKIKIGISKGKKTWNKKESIKEKDIKRENSRENNIRYN